MIFLVTSWVTFTNHASFEKLQADLLPSLLYVINWWYIFHEYSYFDSFGLPSPLTHIWSLAIEEQFYLIWPLLIFLGFTFINKKRVLVLALVVGVILSSLLMAYLYIPGADPSRVYYGTDTRAFSLLLGSALAFVWPSQKLSKTLPRPARFVLEFVGVTALFFIILMFFVTSQYDSFLYYGGMFLLSFFTVLLVASLAHPASILAKWLSLKPVQWIGVRSYGIYLWHYPIIILTTPAVNTAGLEIWRVWLQIAATLVISSLSYRFIESPVRAGKLNKVRETLFTRKGWGILTFYQKSAAVGSFIVIVVLLIGVGAALVTKASETNTITSTSIPIVAVPINEIELIKETYRESVLRGSGTKTEGIKENNPPAKHTKSITIIGDSIIYDVIPYFKNVYPDTIIDYRVGRQMSELPDVITQLEGNGQLGEYVIIQIGTNGPFDQSELIDVIEGLETKEVVLVNSRVPRPWENTVNRTLKDVAASLPNTSLVDWYSASAGNAGFFMSDGVHLTNLGGETYSNLLVEHLADK
jgi:peptidoglycan/LPS O-acetylase OafA/YrhL